MIELMGGSYIKRRKMLTDLIEDICIIVEKDMDKDEMKKSLRQLVWYYYNCSVEEFISRREKRYKRFKNRR